MRLEFVVDEWARFEPEYEQLRAALAQTSAVMALLDGTARKTAVQVRLYADAPGQDLQPSSAEEITGSGYATSGPDGSIDWGTVSFTVTYDTSPVLP